MLTPQAQETPGIALGSPRPSSDMSLYEEPGYRSSSYAVRGISSLFTVASLVDGAGGYPLELLLVRNSPAQGLVCPKTSFPTEWLPGSLQTIETSLILSRC